MCRTDAWGTLVSVRRGVLQQWYPLIGGCSQEERAKGARTIGEDMETRCSQYLVWFLPLLLGPSCFAQGVTVRVINAANGHPLQKQSVTVSLLYEKGERTPAKYDATLRLETDVNGEAHFRLPEPPVHFSAQVRVDWSHWKCGCGVLGSTDDLIRKGILGPVPTAKSENSATLFKVVAGEILFVARPLSFFERLLYPFLKG